MTLPILLTSLSLVAVASALCAYILGLSVPTWVDVHRVRKIRQHVRGGPDELTRIP